MTAEALFAEDECGHRRPAPIAPPSPGERDRATLNAGMHPASGAPLLRIAMGEKRGCRDCAFCGYVSDRPGRLVCAASLAEAGEPQRTRLTWPACAAFVPDLLLDSP